MTGDAATACVALDEVAEVINVNICINQREREQLGTQDTNYWEWRRHQDVVGYGIGCWCR
jgi:hypothetical protein